MHRLPLCLAVAALVITLQIPSGRGQQPNPARLLAPRLDAHGDPLPPGALARLGTLRFRHRNQGLAGLTPDGKSLVLYGREGLQVMDAATGEITQWSKSNHLLPSAYSQIISDFGGRARGPIANLIFP